MEKGYEYSNETKPDIKSGGDTTNTDFAGDLASDDGMDLNVGDIEPVMSKIKPWQSGVLIGSAGLAAADGLSGDIKTQPDNVHEYIGDGRPAEGRYVDEEDDWRYQPFPDLNDQEAINQRAALHAENVNAVPKFAPNDGFTDEIDTKGYPDSSLPESFSVYGKPQPKGGEYEGDVAEFISNDTPDSFYDDKGNRTDAPFAQELGNYAAPVDAPFEGRGLEGDGSDRIRYEFNTLNPIDAREGPARPYNGDVGGGIQYQTGKDWGMDDEVNFGQRLGDSFDPESKENSDIWPTSVSFEVDNRNPDEIGEDLNANSETTLPTEYLPVDEDAFQASGDLGENTTNNESVNETVPPTEYSLEDEASFQAAGDTSGDFGDGVGGDMGGE